jgi:hypothetical protein
MSSFVGCYNTHTITDATIRVEAGGFCYLEDDNFTACRLEHDASHGGGVIILVGGSAGTLYFYDCTVLNNIGTTGIQSSWTTAQPLIDKCNFYGNRFDSSRPDNSVLFYAVHAGMKITNCIFYDNTALFCIISSFGTLFTLGNCVFSDSVPYATIFSGNYATIENSVTASYPQVHMWTEKCPTSSPTVTRSPAKTLSPAQTYAGPSPTPLASPVETLAQTPLSSVSPIETPSPTQSWYCEVYDGVTSRVTVLCPFCVEVTNSLFHDTSSTSGGGISIWTSTAEVTINETTFHSSRASFGGGIDYSGVLLSLSRCCLIRTVAFYYGTALEFLSGKGFIDVNETIFFGCESDAGSSCWGTIADDLGVDTHYIQLNFSFCDLGSLSDNGRGGDGAVFYLRSDSGIWNFSYSTILGCFGSSGIRSYSASHCELSYCNIYDNIISGESALIHCLTFGVVISQCIFSNNNCTALFVLDDFSDNSGFQILNCVFSSDIPDISIYDATNDNLFNTETQSFSFLHLNEKDCPTITPSPSDNFDPTKDLTISSDFPATLPLVDSSFFSASNILSESNYLTDSGQFAITFAFSDSDPFIATILDDSSPLLDSDIFSGSDLLTESDSLTVSSLLPVSFVLPDS